MSPMAACVPPNTSVNSTSNTGKQMYLDRLREFIQKQAPETNERYFCNLIPCDRSKKGLSSKNPLISFGSYAVSLHRTTHFLYLLPCVLVLATHFLYLLPCVLSAGGVILSQFGILSYVKDVTFQCGICAAWIQSPHAPILHAHH